MDTAAKDRVRGVLDAHWPGDFIFPHDRNGVMKRYGSVVLGEYDQLLLQYSESETEENRRKLLAFLYRTGLFAETYSDHLLRSRETLLSLLAYFSERKDAFTIADLGSGIGKISLGLAACLPQVERVYAVECLSSGLQSMQEEKKKLDPSVSRKLHAFHGNYLHSGLAKELVSLNKRPFDVALFSFFESSLEEALITGSALIHDRGEIILSGDSNVFLRSDTSRGEEIDSFYFEAHDTLLQVYSFSKN
ncbi:hypothetical protein HZA98_05035 [Candidatus Woesearchaeota archaeon]|nr:hypothetical protein [Candidatus Woesearchaeota archaeon]